MAGEESYYARRAREERAAAERATDDRARRSHLDLAERYDAASGAAGPASAPPSGSGPLLPPDLTIIP